MAADFLKLESLLSKISSRKNFLKPFFFALLKKSLGLMYKIAFKTKTVFKILIRVKSLNGRKCETRSAGSYKT